jgi:hypothetical protein
VIRRNYIKLTNIFQKISSPATTMNNFSTSSMFSLSSQLFPSGTTTTTTTTAITATFDSPTSKVNTTLLSKKYTPSSSTSMLPLSLSSPILFPSDTTTTATANTAAIAAAIAIAIATDTDTDTDTDSPEPEPEPALQLQLQLQLQRKRKSSVKRSVHFLPMVAVRKTISRHSMTQEEKCNCWLQANEFLMIKERNYNMIVTKQLHQLCGQKQLGQQQECILNNNPKDSVHNNNNNNNNEASESESESFCLRGLEWGIESESIRRKTYRLGALEEVFIEQEAQYLGDYYDDEAIAYAYYSVSSECQLLAGQIAMQDRKDIEEYIFDDYETF